MMMLCRTLSSKQNSYRFEDIASSYADVLAIEVLGDLNTLSKHLFHLQGNSTALLLQGEDWPNQLASTIRRGRNVTIRSGLMLSVV